MTDTAIVNAKVWDGDADTPFEATVVVRGNRIDKVLRGSNQDDLPEDQIDGTGMTLMPGMVEGHCHPSFTGINEPPELGRICPEEHMLLTARARSSLFDSFVIPF